MTEKQQEEKGMPQNASLLEWITAAIGLLLVTGAIGFLIYRGATKNDTPPDIQIKVESISQTGANYLVKILVTNKGETTAADLNVEAELKNGEKSEETASVTLTYLPAQSERRAGLIFSKDPNNHQLQIRPKGYEVP